MQVTADIYNVACAYILLGRDRIVVGFITTYAITTNDVSSNHTHGEVYLIQHYVIKFVSDLRQVDGFLHQ